MIEALQLILEFSNNSQETFAVELVFSISIVSGRLDSSNCLKGTTMLLLTL